MKEYLSNSDGDDICNRAVRLTIHEGLGNNI